MEDRVAVAAKIAVWIAGAAWAVATFFVIPVVRARGCRPVAVAQAFGGRRQGAMGRGATGTVTISAVTGVVVLLMILIGAVCGFALFASGLQPLAIAVMAIVAFDGRTRRR